MDSKAIPVPQPTSSPHAPKLPQKPFSIIFLTSNNILLNHTKTSPVLASSTTLSLKHKLKLKTRTLAEAPPYPLRSLTEASPPSVKPASAPFHRTFTLLGDCNRIIYDVYLQAGNSCCRPCRCITAIGFSLSL